MPKADPLEIVSPSFLKELQQVIAWADFADEQEVGLFGRLLQVAIEGSGGGQNVAAISAATPRRRDTAPSALTIVRRAPT